MPVAVDTWFHLPLTYEYVHGYNNGNVIGADVGRLWLKILARLLIAVLASVLAGVCNFLMRRSPFLTHPSQTFLTYTFHTHQTAISHQSEGPDSCYST